MDGGKAVRVLGAIYQSGRYEEGYGGGLTRGGGVAGRESAVVGSMLDSAC
jgi:hypothetical protein